MKTTGVKKQPAAIVKLKGNYRPSRYKDEIAESEITFLTKVPPPPERLKGDGIILWNNILYEGININGYIAITDIYMFEQLCYVYQTMTAAQKDIELFGNTELDKNGNRRKSQGYIIYKENLKDFIILCREFGLSPSSRTGIKLNHGSTVKTDPLAAFSL